MSRRVGQTGNVFQRGFTKLWNPSASAYGRYYIDTSEGRKRQTITLGICATRTCARRKLREHIDSEGINSKQAFSTNTASALTFREQAERWIAALATRRRKPVKPATIFNWQHVLDGWILPNLGDKLMSEVSNGALRELVEKMAAAGLSATTIVNYVQPVKMVIASAVDAEGDQIYPRKWNHEFIQLPIVNKDQQHQPTVDATEIESILANAKGQYAVLFALLSGSGVRRGEVLALKDTDFSPDCRVLSISRSIWHGQEQAPKTSAAVREVDIPESLAAVLREYSAGKSGHLFATKTGRPLGQRNVLHVLHQVADRKIGFNCFRRFRVTHLRKNRVPEDLLRYWIGHANKSITDGYSKVKEDRAFRTLCVENVGLGFSLDGLHRLQNTQPLVAVTAA
jgi:integrase